MDRIIDIHAHCWTDSFAPRVMAHFENLGAECSFDGTLAGLKRSMDVAGIAVSVALPVATKPKQVPLYNDFLADFTDDDRIVPFATLHPAEDDPVGTVRKAAEAGFKGFKLHPLDQGFVYDDPVMMPVYDAIEQEGLIVLFHTGASYNVPDIGFDNRARLDAYFSSGHAPSRTVLAHLGGGQGPFDLPNPDPQWPCRFDVAFCFNTPFYPHDEIVDLVREVGVDRVLFGTDAPWHDQADDVATARELFSPDELELLFWDNAAKLLGL